ncbi:MAG: GNAT family N-acetyltransferase, partial [Chloroflexota bacterium]
DLADVHRAARMAGGRGARRDATPADVPALAAIKGAGSKALHRDRLRDAREPGFRYLVLLADGDLVGFACLVARRPASWSDAAEAGYGRVYLRVDPVGNPRAAALYGRLGYRPLQAAPYRQAWGFVDSGGTAHRGEDWAVDMVKRLPR